MNTNRAQKTYWEIKTPKEKLIAELIQDTLASRNLHGWTVIFSRAKNVLGSCSHNTKEITISRRVVESDYVKAIDTAMHEVAHAIAGHAAAHGPAWQKIAVELGATPKPALKFIDSSDDGKITSVSTAYGNVQVTLGTSKFYSLSNNKNLTVISVGRGYARGVDEKGSNYRVLADEIHPLHGNPLKIRKRQYAFTTRTGALHHVTLGTSTLKHGGETYYALRIKQKNVFGVTVDGQLIQAPATMFV